MARNTEDMLRMVRELREAGADFASVLQQVNTRGYTGKLFLTILAAFDEMEREATVEHTAIAMQNHQANGRRMGRVDKCPYGKMPDPKGPMIEGRDGMRRPARLIDHPGELAILEQIRQKAAEGIGARAITTWLNDQNIACRGQRWHLTTVRRLLKKVGTVGAGKEGTNESRSAGLPRAPSLSNPSTSALLQPAGCLFPLYCSRQAACFRLGDDRQGHAREVSALRGESILKPRPSSHGASALLFGLPWPSLLLPGSTF